jgi:hypothetical protein
MAAACITATDTARIAAASANSVSTADNRRRVAAAITVSFTEGDAGTPIAVAVEPWAGSDKEAVRKVLRTIVAVGGAGVRRVTIVAIGANRRDTNISGADSDAHGNLRVREGCWEKEDAEEREIT